MDKYQNNGDALSLQYGGSATHHTIFLRSVREKPSLWELDSDYSLHVRSNGDDSHALDA